MGAALVHRWLSVAAGEVAYRVAAARRIGISGPKPVPDDALSRSYSLLNVLDDELETRNWLAASSPTLADLAVYGYVAAAPEGGIDLTVYPNVQSWLCRVESLPGFVPFAKTTVSVAAPA